MRTSAVAILCMGMLGCASPGDEAASDKPHADLTKPDLGAGKAEGWGANDNPTTFSSGLEFSISKLPTSGQAANIPWASTYWPTYQDNINYKWDGPSSMSASAKYGTAFGVSGVEDAVSLYHGIDANSSGTSCTSDSQCNSKNAEVCAKRDGRSSGYCIASWWGICHAWSPASILNLEPKYPVTYNGVTFKVNDLKALVDLVHDATNTRFVSLRCNKDSAGNIAGINFDKYGRPADGDGECRDTNPGTYYVLLTNYLGIKKQSFVEDRVFDYEVWNQPLRGYRVTKIDNISAGQANALVGVAPSGGSTVNRSGSVSAGAWAAQESFNVSGGTIVRVAMTGSGGDADLYVNFNSAPTSSAYACRPYLDGPNETCELAVPAGATKMFVAVNGYSASSYALAVTTGMSASGTYAFNPNAAYFYQVHMQVDYISEAPSEQDGNLGSRIDDYTKTDDYDFVLEVNSGGNVIGGEWIGESKTAHPDFLWLPLGPKNASVAGGKITYANVKMLLDMSMNPPSGGGGGSGGEKTVTDSGTLASGAWKHLGPYSVGAGKTLTATMTGSGDADLYVRKNGLPTLQAFDCRPYQSTTNESCTIVGPAQVYVSVNGYAASSPYSLSIKYTEGNTGVVGNPPPTFTHLNTTGSVAQGEMKVFPLPIPAGKKVVIRTTAAHDVDLYVLMDAQPTADAYTLRGYTDSGNETITYTATSNGTLYIGVSGYEASSFTLKTSDN